MPIIPDLTTVDMQVTQKDFNPLLIHCPASQNIQTADYAIVGEAPSDVEIMTKEPFSGPTGSQFNRICNAVGLPKHRLYLTNACKAKLPSNNPDALWTYKGYRHPQWGELQAQLINELAEFPETLIILFGNTAMHLLLDEPKFSSITKYAGSVYRAEDFPHLTEKLKGKIICITFHPNSSLPRVNPLNFYIIMAHLKKFMKLRDNPELLKPEPNVKIMPEYYECIEFLERANKATQIGFDIECTPRFITCFGIAISSSDVMSIPVMDNHGNYWTEEQEIVIWTKLAEILINPGVRIICQNGMFDLMFILRTMDIKSDNFFFDTMLAQHLCYTDLPKGLDFLTACYTYYPYYKDEGKQSHLGTIKDWEMYWLYNGKDAAYLLEIQTQLESELQQNECSEAMTYVMELHKPLMEMEWKGILVDTKNLTHERARLNKSLRALRKGLNKIAGKELNPNSPKQLVDYFYTELGIKPYTNRQSGRYTCDVVALSRIAKKGTKGSFEAKMIRKIRKNHKLVSTYFDIPFDSDNRIRCAHKISGTSSGRIATEKTFFGTGANLQNQPPAFKKFLISDPGNILCEVDLAKAEAHVVAFLCQDINMIEAFESGIDVHTFNASKIFNCEMSEVTKHMRYMGKRVVHASNYGMGPITFSDNLAADDTFMSINECKDLLNSYSIRFPGLHRWHEQIKREVNTTRTLYNLYNRPRKFLGMLNDSLYRTAFSYIPQSTVAELLNKGLIKCSNDPNLMDVQLLTTVHDSIVFQFPLSHLDKFSYYLNIIKDNLTHTFFHKGRSFTIGVDAKIGYQWSGKTIELTDFSQDNIVKCVKSLD